MSRRTPRIVSTRPMRHPDIEAAQGAGTIGADVETQPVLGNRRMLVVGWRIDDGAEIHGVAPRTILESLFARYICLNSPPRVRSQRKLGSIASVGECGQCSEHGDLRERFHLAPPGVVCRDPNQPLASALPVSAGRVTRS